MPKHYSLLIPGAKPAAKKLEVTAPFDSQLIATVDTVDQAGIEQALCTANNLFNNRSKWLTAAQRIQILTNAMHLMHEKAEQLTLIAAQEGGKPLSDSQVEMTRAIDGISNCVECIRSNHGEEIPGH